MFLSTSWKVLRSQLKDPSYDSESKAVVKSSTTMAKASTNQSAASEWCEDVDDWGDDCAGEVQGDDGWDSLASVLPQEATLQEAECTHRVEDMMKDLTLQEDCVESHDTPVVMATTASYSGPYYLAAFISVVEEPEIDAHEDERLLKKYKIEPLNGDFSSEAEWKKVNTHNGGHRQRGKAGRRGDAASAGGESYEKGVARHGDKTFQKFHKNLSRFPQQILRYG